MNSTLRQNETADSRPDRWPEILFAAYAAVWILAAIKPFNRQDWFLENMLVFGSVPVLVATYRRFRFSNFSYAIITIYLTLHAVGAHYTYSEVPLFNWLRDEFQLSRNHYDRVIHFLFGFFIAYPLWEVLVRVTGLRRGLACLWTVHIIIAWSALYEMIEAAVAHLVSPELGAAYNGTQGDIWDAQKDSALATFGAILCMTITAWSPKRIFPRWMADPRTAASPKQVIATPSKPSNG